MRWITWSGVGVDRIACAWLIRRALNQDPEFVCIPRGSDWKELDGIPFDIPGANLSHRRGRCTFCTILKEYAINDRVMDQICAIVDAADSVNDLLPPPEAPGIDVICRGLVKVLKDDARALEVGAILFEALYVQLSDEA
jgi:hypothetical protein